MKLQPSTNRIVIWAGTSVYIYMNQLFMSKFKIFHWSCFLADCCTKQDMPKIEVFGFRRLHLEGGSTHKQTSNPVQFGARLLIFVAWLDKCGSSTHLLAHTVNMYVSSLDHSAGRHKAQWFVFHFKRVHFIVLF